MRKRDKKAIQKHAYTIEDRTIDEIKDRFYSVSKALLISRQQKDHPIV